MKLFKLVEPKKKNDMKKRKSHLDKALRTTEKINKNSRR